MPEGLNLTPILVPLATLLLGWVIGFFDSNNRTSKKIKQAEDKAQTAINDAQKMIADARVQAAASAVQTPVDDPGLLRLKNERGRYALEMDGAPVTGALSPDKRKRLIDLLTVIRPFLEGQLPPQAAPQPAAPVQTPPMPAPVQQAASRPAPVMPTPPPTVKPVSPTLGTAISSVIGGTKKPAAEEKPFASLSIVGQIDSVLQGHLVNSPLAGKGIRLQESVHGGVEVYVGINKYPSVDDVPDEQVKAAIRAAIAEWEKKYVPGA